MKENGVAFAKGGRRWELPSVGKQCPWRCLKKAQRNRVDLKWVMNDHGIASSSERGCRRASQAEVITRSMVLIWRSRVAQWWSIAPTPSEGKLPGDNAFLLVFVSRQVTSLCQTPPETPSKSGIIVVLSWWVCKWKLKKIIKYTI